MVLLGFLGEWFLQVRRSSGRIAEFAQRGVIAFRQPARTNNASTGAELLLLKQRRSRTSFSLHLLVLGSARPAAVLNGGLPAVRKEIAPLACVEPGDSAPQRPSAGFATTTQAATAEAARTISTL